ncbi:DNA/RNA non-specific endonuclease [Parendozoicomonas haliclonae]|uniref:Putative ribonuclease YeeF n=1 Tax=Parendozoicomonas haliclonae TaxID=1960125 RepID=A0A1X7ARC0_9GAMM|nr:DNA/RNA non-specific endonuclease [Parendozoicomonas haliclonae]SMA50638.1 putative ribonuclease YeeF [Parendozoicomonas haliclonae]
MSFYCFIVSVYTYETDHLGRVVNVKGKLKLSPLGNKDRNESHRSLYRQKKYGPDVARSEDKVEQYDGGHLIATLFIGPAEKINMIPQLRRKNQNRKIDGQWYNMERDWAVLLESDPPSEVDIEINIAYEDDQETPKTLWVDSTIDGIIQPREEFEN